MKGLLSLFPANDFSLIAVILAMPLLGAFVNGVFGRRLGKDAVRLMALASVGASFVAAVATFLALDSVVDATKTTTTVAGHEVVHHAHAKLAWTAWEWMRVSGLRDVSIPIDLRFSVDGLSGVMMLVVTGVGFLIHVYAASYMEEDRAYWRFFSYLNLFIFSMLVLVLGDNLPVLFIGWEGVGLCSYLLIGFWYGKSANASAGKKAFIMNRIGDFGLICGMFLLVYYTGALDWAGIESHAQDLLTSKETSLHLWPIGNGAFRDWHGVPLHLLQPDDPVRITAATAVGLALFLGCTGKSAQLPLYTWLPDAMAGPTPVSALIHAATMVTAGVYLICRMSFVFVLSPPVMTVIAFTGALTALFAATLALVQTDIKRVLAFSTVSQLGFMFLGVGVGSFTAGFFHLFTHAFFKACLFLGAGSVIHAMHARVHDDDRSQDMRNMGGLRRYMPLTYGTFVAATVAIIGLPFTSGWFSKDEILASALVNKVSPAAELFTRRGVEVWTAPSWAPWLLWGMGVLAATLTAFYMCRCVFMTFWGDFKGWTIGRPSMLAKPEAERGDDHDDRHRDRGDNRDDGDDDDEDDEELSQPGHPPHESSRIMTIPLIILGALSIGAGVLNPAALKVVFPRFEALPIDRWLDPVFHEQAVAVTTVARDAHGKDTLELVSLAGAFLAFALGSSLAYRMYVTEKGRGEHAYMTRATRIAAGFGGALFVVLGALIALLDGAYTPRHLVIPLGLIVLGAWLVWRVRAVGLDFIYERSAVSATDALADTAASFDESVVDFLIARLTSLIVAASGTLLRVVHNGVVHVYAAIMVVGVTALGWFFVQPHADATVTESANGDYVLLAAPGVGYGFRWSPEAGEEPSIKDFTGTEQLKVHLEEGKSQTVRLEVRNAFGRTTSSDVTLTRPRADKPQLSPRGER